MCCSWPRHDEHKSLFRGTQEDFVSTGNPLLAKKKTQLALNLAALRKARGWNQKQLAAALGVKTEVTVSNHERSATEPDAAQVARYAVIFGVSESDLRYQVLGRDAAVPPPERPQAVRKVLAKAVYDLTTAGLTDDQIKLVLALVESDQWHALWRAMRGDSAVRDIMLDGMEVLTRLVQYAHVQAEMDRLVYDRTGELDQKEMLRVIARAPKEMITRVVAGGGTDASPRETSRETSAGAPDHPPGHSAPATTKKRRRA